MEAEPRRAQKGRRRMYADDDERKELVRQRQRPYRERSAMRAKRAGDQPHMAAGPSHAARATGDVSDFSDGSLGGAPVAIVEGQRGELGGNSGEFDDGAGDGDDGDEVCGEASGGVRGKFDKDQ